MNIESRLVEIDALSYTECDSDLVAQKINLLIEVIENFEHEVNIGGDSKSDMKIALEKTRARVVRTGYQVSYCPKLEYVFQKELEGITKRLSDLARICFSEEKKQILPYLDEYRLYVSDDVKLAELSAEIKEISRY